MKIIEELKAEFNAKNDKLEKLFKEEEEARARVEAIELPSEVFGLLTYKEAISNLISLSNKIDALKSDIESIAKQIANLEQRKTLMNKALITKTSEYEIQYKVFRLELPLNATVADYLTDSEKTELCIEALQEELGDDEIAEDWDIFDYSYSDPKKFEIIFSKEKED